MSDKLTERERGVEGPAWDVGPLPGRRTSLPHEIASALAERIRSGEVPVGTRLPSEPALAYSLDVSRNTVREAISVLRGQSLVATKQGLGTYTLDHAADTHFPVDIGIEHLTSTTEMITRAGHKAGTRDFSLVTGPSDQAARERLRIQPDEQIHTIERVRTADDLAVVLCRDHISSAVVETTVIARYRGEESLFTFLHRECRLAVHTARADIVPTLPSARVAAALAMSRRRPVLVLYQHHYDRDGNLFLYSENIFNPAYMGLHVRRTPVA